MTGREAPADRDWIEMEDISNVRHFTVVKGPEEESHRCQDYLPRRGWLNGRDRHLCRDGVIVQCDFCGQKWKWGRYLSGRPRAYSTGWHKYWTQEELMDGINRAIKNTPKR